MKKILSLSLVATAVLLNASETANLEKIDVVETTNSQIVKDVSDEQIKSAITTVYYTKNLLRSVMAEYLIGSSHV